MNGSPKRSRAKHACKECNQRRVRCDVMDKHPCTNCEATHATCLILPSRRGRYPRKTRQLGVKQEAPESPQVTTKTASAVPRPAPPRESSTDGPVLETSPPAPAKALTGAAIPEGGNLFFGESNFLTLVPSGRQETRPTVVKGRLSFPLNTVSTPQPDHHSAPSMTVIHLSQGTERYLKDEGALTFPAFSTSLPVIQAYFKWFHPCFPVLDRPTVAQKLANMDISPFLLQAMLFIGATYCEEEAVIAMGFRDRTEAKSLLYTRARLLFHADWEKDRITLIQGLFLMSFWRGESSDVRDVRYWLGVVITLAETCGLHRSTKLTTRNTQMARIRRRIWWSVYAREGQSAASLGLPMRIRNEDCDIEPLTAQDLSGDRDDSPLTALGSPTPEHVVYPVKMAELARLLGNIIDVHFIPGRTPTAQEEIIHLQTSLEEWKDSLPAELRRISAEDDPSVLSCLLHLAYNHLRILIHRNGFLRHHEADMQAALGAASQISRIAEDMLDKRTLQYGQMHLITSLFAALCIHAINLKTADGVGRRLAEHRAQICLLGLKEVQKFWRINNTVLDLFLQYLDESIARRLRGDGGGGDTTTTSRDEHAVTTTTTTTGTGTTAALTRVSSAAGGVGGEASSGAGPGLDPVARGADPPQQPSSSSEAANGGFEDQYFNFLSMNWEGENAIDDLGLILDPQFQAQSPAGGPMQLDGLNSLERWL